MRTRISKRTRNAVFSRCKWRCVSCGVHTPKQLHGLEDPLAPTLDHIIPLSKGGKNGKSNLQLLCFRCNQIKGDR